MSEDARNAFRALQLPCRHTAEDRCAEHLEKYIQGLSGVQANPGSWLDLELNGWRLSGMPSRVLRDLFRQLFVIAAEFEADTTRQAYLDFSLSYFEAHASIVEIKRYSFTEATATLSHASLIIALAAENQLSAAQMARMVSPKDSRANLNRQVIAEILRYARIPRKIARQQVVDVFSRDAEGEIAAFRDASLEVAAREVALAAESFSASGDLLLSLLELTPVLSAEGALTSPYTPYLQILHYQCTIAEYYDHDVRDLYEFSPRGEAAEWLFNQYPSAIAGASNPFLNNAKSVEVLDEGWVRSKKSAETPGARALLAIIKTMDGMGFLARRELSRWIRMWLHRIIRVSRDKLIELPGVLDHGDILKIAGAIKRGNTRTYGILEQRFVDALTCRRHAGLRHRGLGDAVNTTNVSKRKFGDCEFVDNAAFEIFAYEAHGGALTQLYIQRHLLSLRKSVSNRSDELALIADLEQWTATVCFVAHDVSRAHPVGEEILGVNFKIELETFQGLCDDVGNAQPEELVAFFNKYFLAPISSRWTPNKVRQELLNIIQAA